MVSEFPDLESPMKRFRVRFRDGVVWTIFATSFQREIKPDDLVRFYNAHNVENQNVFLRAVDVSAIAPDLDLEVAPPIAELQENFKLIEARVSALESNIGEVVMRAVDAAFARRGM
jgi:hypothetical protein